MQLPPLSTGKRVCGTLLPLRPGADRNKSGCEGSCLRVVIFPSTSGNWAPGIVLGGTEGRTVVPACDHLLSSPTSSQTPSQSRAQCILPAPGLPQAERQHWPGAAGGRCPSAGPQGHSHSEYDDRVPVPPGYFTRHSVSSPSLGRPCLTAIGQRRGPRLREVKQLTEGQQGRAAV